MLRSSKIEHIWFSVIAVGILGIIGKYIFNNKELITQVVENKGFFRVVGEGCIKIFMFVTKNYLTAILLFCFIVAFLGGIAGKFNIFDRLAFAGEQFWMAIANYENEVDGAWKPEEVAGEQILEAHSKALENYDGNLEDITRMKIYPSEVNLMLNLSDRECANVFFLQGEYAIEDWEDQDEVNNKVLQWVADARKVGYINKFDDFAPQEKKDEIHKASEDEVNAEQFSTVKRINTTRSDIYTTYPKKSIANLLANGNQKLALILLYNDGQRVTILYYYSQSVIWEMEFLKYCDIANSTVKDHLTKIAKRHEDIKLVCPMCEEAKYAEKLQIAFENAANQY